MKYLYWGIITLVLVSFYSCSRSEGFVDDLKMVGVLNEDSPLKVNLYDIVDSISYIPLSSENCLLTYIERVEYDSCYYFVKDAKGLYVFDESGRFVSEIGRKGQGPGEYFYINSFYLDREKKNVCIISYPDRKLLTYGYSGNFLSMNRLEREDAYVSSVASMPGGELLVHRPLSNETDENGYEYVALVSRQDSYISYPLLENIGLKSQNVHYSFLRSPIAVWDGEYYAVSTLSNIVYRYVNRTLLPEFCLDMPDISPTKAFIKSNIHLDFFSLSKLLDEKKIGKGIMAVASSDKNLFMLVKDGQTVVYDGKDAIVIAPFVYHSDIDSYLYNLFSGGLFDTMLGHCEAETLLSRREYIEKGNNPKLKLIVAEIHEDDNPVIFRCHLKQDLMERLRKMI